MKKEEFLQRYQDLGWNYKEPRPFPALRVNTLLIKEEALVQRLKEKGVVLEKVPNVKHGYFIKKSPFSLASTIEYLKGYFFLQDAAAQRAVEVLNPTKQDLVLDMCASPGGKTTQMAQKMNNEGVIVSLELKKERLVALKNNLERCQVKNVIVYNINARDSPKLHLLFDKILLDAPCSGNFSLERGWFEKRDLDGIRRNAQLQKELLAAGFDALKPQGELVYATCSLEPEEDENNCSWFQKRFPVKMISFERVWPDKTHGFFLAKFVRLR